MPELPNFFDPTAVLEWLNESLPTEDWEVLKVELVTNGYHGLVDWFDPLTGAERESYVADPQARESVVQWLAGASAGDEVAAEPTAGSADAWNDGADAWNAEGAAESDAPAGTPGEGTWDDARQAWIFYDPAQGWLTADGRPVAEADAAGQPAAAESAAPEPAAADPAAAEPAAAAAPDTDTPPAEPPLPELPETTQSMVDEAIDEEIAPVFEEAFNSIEGLDQLSPEDLREVLAAALAESGVSG